MTKEAIDRRAHWNTSGNQVLRAVKKWCLGGRRISLCGRKYLLPYEARDREEQDDYYHIKRMATGARCVFDIGANIGLTSLIIADAMSDEGQLFAFEASEASCLVWHETMVVNGFGVGDQAQVINTLVGSHSGHVAPFDWDFVAGNASSVSESKSKSKLKLQKVCTTIDRITEQLRLSPQFAKIDVEGAELEVLDGMKETLQRHRPAIFIEIHGWPGRSVADQAAEVEVRLRNVGYEVRDLDGAILRPNVPRDGERMTRCWAVATHPAARSC